MSGGSSSNKGSSKSTDLTPGEFVDLRGPLRDFFLNFALPNLPSAFSFQSPVFEGGEQGLDAFRAPITEGEQAALAAVRGQQGGTPTETAADQLLQSTLQGDFLTPGGANPALADVIRFTTQAINDEFNSGDLERRALFSRAGQRISESSPFSVAQAESDTGRLRAIGESTSNILFNAFEQERGRQVQAVEQARATAGFNLERSSEILRAEALPRLIDQLGIEGGMREFEARLGALSNALGIAAGLADVSTGQESKSKGSSKQGAFL